MVIMDESSFVAHALRDFLRVYADESALSDIDASLSSGESIEAIGWALAVATQFEAVLPRYYVDRILALEFLDEVDAESFKAQIATLKIYDATA